MLAPEQEEEVVPAAVDGDNNEKTEEEPLPALPNWPPSSGVREKLIHTLAESLSSPSGLFQRYGPIPYEEAAAAARRSEQEAFAAVVLSTPAAAVDDHGTETIDMYTKEFSNRVADFCMARRFSSSSPSPTTSAAAAAADAIEKAPRLNSRDYKA